MLHSSFHPTGHNTNPLIAEVRRPAYSQTGLPQPLQLYEACAHGAFSVTVMQARRSYDEVVVCLGIELNKKVSTWLRAIGRWQVSGLASKDQNVFWVFRAWAYSHRTLVDAKLDNYFETAKEFRSFFLFMVYGVSEDGENSLLVLLCSVEDVEKKNRLRIDVKCAE